MVTNGSGRTGHCTCGRRAFGSRRSAAIVRAFAGECRCVRPILPDVQETAMPARKTDKTSKPAARKPAERMAAGGKAATTLPEAMTGRASPAKAADGDKPVFAYIASLPQPQRGIAESVDALAAKTLPGLQRSVKWGMSYYGVGDGWCFCCGGFADHVKL